MTLCSKSLLSIAAALGLAASALPAFSQDDTVQGVTVYGRPSPGVVIRREVVRFGDLDLSNGRDYDTLVSRVHAAALRVCSPGPSTNVDLGQVSEFENCVQPAVADALSQAGGRG